MPIPANPPTNEFPQSTPTQPANPFTPRSSTPTSGQQSWPGSGVSPADAGIIRNQGQFDPTNPGFAFDNALRAMGINPLSPSPIVAMLKRSGTGLAQAYLQSAAQGNNPDEISGGYRDFLSSVLGGGGAGIFGTLNSARQNFGSSVGAARSFFDKLEADPSLSEINPLMAILAQTLFSGGGAGGIQGLSALSSPFMPGRFAQAYTGALGGAGQSAMARMFREYQGGTERPDLFQYLGY